MLLLFVVPGRFGPLELFEAVCLNAVFLTSRLDINYNFGRGTVYQDVEGRGKDI